VINKKTVFLFCGLLIWAGFTDGYAKCGKPGCIYFPTYSKVYETCSDGKVTQIDLPVDPNDMGCFIPILVSPDECYISYRFNHNLWLYDTRTKQSAQITKDGIPADDKYFDVGVCHSVWSEDSSKVMYAVYANDGRGCEDGPCPDMRDADEGTHIYDLKSGTATSWPPAYDGKRPLPDSIPNGYNQIPLHMIPNRQLYFSARDAKAIVWDYYEKRIVSETDVPSVWIKGFQEIKVMPFSENTRTIFDMAAKKSITLDYDVSDVAYSPSGKKIAWINASTIEVNTQAVALFGQEPSGFAWIDEDTLAVNFRNEVLVVKIGKEPKDYSPLGHTQGK